MSLYDRLNTLAPIIVRIRSVTTTMKISESQTTDEILIELGDRLRRYRLQQNRTVAEMAADAGVGFSTARRAESGANPTLETLVKLLRALGRLDALESFLPTPVVSPIQMAALSGRMRQRASQPRLKKPRDARHHPHD